MRLGALSVVRAVGAFFLPAGRAGAAGLVAAGVSLAALAPAAAQTALTEDGSLRIAGFGTLGLTHLDAPPGWGFRRDPSMPGQQSEWSALTDSRLGAQLNASFGPQLELVTQVVASRRGRDTPDDERVTWAFAGYRPDPQTQVRAGRIGTQMLLMSDHRDVGFASLAVRPPVEFYGFIPQVFDGMDLTRDAPVFSGRWRGSLFAGSARVGDYDADGVFRSLAGGAALGYEADGLILRTTFVRSEMASEPAGLVSVKQALSSLESMPVAAVAAQARQLRLALPGKGAMGSYWAFGAAWEGGDWRAMGEWLWIRGLPSRMVQAGYALLGRRVGAVTLYGQLGHLRSAQVDIAAPQWEAALTPAIGAAAAARSQRLGTDVAANLSASNYHQFTRSLGARWEAHPKLVFKLQADFVAVEPGGGALWSPSDAAGMHAHVFGLTADFLW